MGVKKKKITDYNGKCAILGILLLVLFTKLYYNLTHFSVCTKQKFSTNLEMRWSATGEEHRSWVEHMIGRQRRGGGTLRLRPRGVWNGGRGLIIFSENTPQKEFQNSQLCSCWRNRSNKFLFRLYTNVASLKQNHERRAPTRTFPLKFCSAIPAAADGDAAARCTCPAYLLRVGSFPVLPLQQLMFSSFSFSTLKLFCPVTGYPKTCVSRE